MRKECKQQNKRRKKINRERSLTSMLPQRFRVIVHRYSDLLLILLFLFVNDATTTRTCYRRRQILLRQLVDPQFRSDHVLARRQIQLKVHVHRERVGPSFLIRVTRRLTCHTLTNFPIGETEIYILFVLETIR